MKWMEIRVTTTSEASDAVSDMLVSIGAGGVAIEDPEDIRKEIARADSLDYADDAFINSLGDDVTVKAYFPGDRSIIELSELIKEKIGFISNFLDTGKGYSGYSEVDEEDWSTAWKKYYKPLKIGDRVVVKPSWEEYAAKGDEIIIEMDPGMAFGTGTHETTRMCAKALERYVKKGDTVLDVGCGTGILSIVAAKLGSGSITAVDIDEIAVRVTRENSALNSVSGQIDAYRAVLSDVPETAHDIVVANIISNIIIGISEIMPRYLKPAGVLITSGIIRERKSEVIEAYSKLGFKVEEVEEMGEWVAIIFKCQGSL